jgi:hypothetical protein
MQSLYAVLILNSWWVIKIIGRRRLGKIPLTQDPSYIYIYIYIYIRHIGDIMFFFTRNKGIVSTILE